jgi:RND family efflux transporter MFP subunit
MTYRTRSIVVGVGLAMLLSGCQRPLEETIPIRPVRTITVGDLQAIRGREFPGRAAAKNEVDISFRVSGPLISLPVDVGSQVQRGDVIAAIDPRDFQTALDSAQANLDRAKANLLAMERGARPEEIEQLRAALLQAEASFEQASADHQRNERLVVTGAASRSEFEVTLARKERTAADVTSAREALNIGLTGARPEDLEAKRSEIRSLESAVTAAKNQLADASLLAPFDGEVVARHVSNFQTVQAKQPILRLLDMSVIEVTVQIPESLISLVPQLNKVACRFDALPGREFSGTVTKTGREASRTTRTFPVTVEIQQSEDAVIFPGMASMVRHPAEGHEPVAPETLTIPMSSLFTEADTSQTYVWVVDAATRRVARREVKVGDLTPVGLTIVEGLHAGELVITAGVNTIREGQEVRIP